MKLIDKDKVNEILRNLWKEDDGHNSEHRICYNKALQEVSCKIDTLEVKEVNVENSFDATVCKNYNTYLKEMDKDSIAKALEPYKNGDKVKIFITKEE